MHFTHAEQLYAAMRRLAPQVRAILSTTPDDRPRHLHVSYGEYGPWTVEWDGTQYRWASGPYQSAQLGTDAEDAAAGVAERLAAPLPDLTDPPHRSWPNAPGAGLTI